MQETGERDGKNLLFPAFAVTLFVGLFIVALAKLFWQAPFHVDQLIAKDVSRLAHIIERIDQKCEILSIERQRVYVDFLNVTEFEGSELGPLNLAYPQQWPALRQELEAAGYDLDDNPTIQEREYQIVTTKDGYFIVPGDGVRLSNGKIIGQDIVFGENSDILDMIKQGGDLVINGRALAAPLRIQINPIKEAIQENIFKADVALEIDTLSAKSVW